MQRQSTRPSWPRSIVLCLSLLAGTSPVAAQESFASKLERGDAEISALETRFAEGDVQAATLLGEAVADSAWIREFTNDCINQSEARIARLSAELQELGSGTALDTPQIGRMRDGLEADLRAAAENLGRCRLLSLRRQELVDVIAAQRQQLLTRHLLSQGPNLWQVVSNTLSDPLQLWNTSVDFVLRDSGVNQFGAASLALTGALVGVGFWLGIGGRRALLRQAQRLSPGEAVSAGLLRSALACLGHYLPHLVVTTTAAVCLSVAQGLEGTPPVVTLFLYGLGLYLLLLISIRVFLHPCPPAEPWLATSAEITQPMARRLQVLALLLLIGFLFFATLSTRSFPEPIQLLARAVYGAFLALNLIWVAWLAGRLPHWRKPKRIAFALTLVLLAALGAEWLGYRNLSVFVTRGLVVSLLTIGLLVLLTRTLRELFDTLDEGRYEWQRRLRLGLGISDGKFVPGLSWLRFIIAVSLWGGAAIVLLRTWGLSDAGLDQLISLLSEGFEIGEIKIVPRRVLFGILILSLLLGIAGWVKKQSANQWFRRTRMDRGAREAGVTMIGYVGAAIAILAALSVAGVEFTNLAIIAGALSVGIGFGLQNIVNNFVSGLILLFERPIRTGDWIVVGGTEGYVRQISIRSTRIQTFDRADVIVPNSELISGQVTNWMLDDPWGRLKLPVGVAYGSDTAKVKALLLEAARQHELVIDEHPVVPPPIVIFIGFGASSLDFELRCFISQIDSRLRVMSDLNFAIDEAFRAAGIEIPFPQRDVHIRGKLPDPDPDPDRRGPEDRRRPDDPATG